METVKSRGFQVVLANSDRSKRVDHLLDLIDGAVYTSEVPWTKPSPEAFRAAMDAVGGDEPGRCVYVGDRLYDDIWGARHAGLRAIHVPHSVIPAEQVSQPRVEAEIAFVLREDLADGPLDADRVRRATDYVVAALEVCGSRISNWDISFADTVADNASAGAYVLGDRKVLLGDLDLTEVQMTMSIDGTQVSEGTGAACLGDPVAAVVWLAQTAADLGRPQRAGQVVLSGALGPMRAVAAGQSVTATLTGLGSVSASFQ